MTTTEATVERNGNTVTAIAGDENAALCLRSARGDEITIILMHDQWAALVPILTMRRDDERRTEQ